ncbi:MAG: serine/threonine-protein kinase [Planctomycetota bacterium]|jgi:hypothetical protein|nr:serine/threonine-protein kinase [Planctomycetota bacterium]
MASVNWDALGGDIFDEVLSAEDEGPDFGDRYELRDLLGQGGQGTVYRCWDRSLEREVAVKCMRDPGRNQRPLLEEARLLSRLAHPAIPQVYDRGASPNGGAFVAIQLINGDRLDHAIETLDLSTRLRLFRGVAGAVAHAHGRGILHRDLKPENVMVCSSGDPYLVDWGLAAKGDPRAICGSPYFAAPEQLDGQPADPRADIYALGVLLYFILTRQLPYGRSVKSFQEFQRQRAALTRVSLCERDGSLPRALERITETAMAAQPGARYQQVDDLLDDLSAFEAGRPLARDLPILPWRRVGMVAALLMTAAGSAALGYYLAPDSMIEAPASQRLRWDHVAPLPPDETFGDVALPDGEQNTEPVGPDVTPDAAAPGLAQGETDGGDSVEIPVDEPEVAADAATQLAAEPEDPFAGLDGLLPDPPAETTERGIGPLPALEDLLPAIEDDDLDGGRRVPSP